LSWDKLGLEIFVLVLKRKALPGDTVRSNKKRDESRLPVERDYITGAK
jgi:hypothetical protein